MNPKNSNTNEYLKTKVLTASPEQLQLMLYDGAIRFCEQARVAIENQHIEESYNFISKAEKIVMELCLSMKEDIAPDTCTNMRRLYMFCYDRLVYANMKKDLDALNESLEILTHIRETWILLMEKLREERSSQPQTVAACQSTDDLQSLEIGATINFEG